MYDEAAVFRSIVQEHLDSPSMLVILPIADWMSIDAKLHLQNAQDEQINHPEDPHQRWEYRLPCRLCEMSKIAPNWGRDIRNLLVGSGRL